MGNDIVALIPARAGSKRVKDKNIKMLGGHPLIAYTIECAKKSKIFDRIIVSTESDHIANIAGSYGAEVPFYRPAEFAGDLSTDFDWISYTMDRLEHMDKYYKYFAILRPTSPFRTPSMLRRAWDLFISNTADSLRAVEKCTQHPYKMWLIDEESQRMTPFIKELVDGKNGHSMPYQALPEIYVQNASLEIARTDVLTEYHAITGEIMIPFITEGHEGFDINTQHDWDIAERIIAQSAANRAAANP